MATLKNAPMTEQRTASIAGKIYTRRKWSDDFVQHYRHDKRKACLVRLDPRKHVALIVKINLNIDGPVI